MVAVLGIAIFIGSCKKSTTEDPVYTPYNENGMWGYTPDLYPTDMDWKSGTGSGIGYINKTGSMVIAQQFSLGSPFSFDLANVAKEDGGFLRHGFCDRTGNIIIPLIYENCGKFTADGLAWVKNAEGKYGFIDRQGNLKIPCQFNQVFHFHDGLAAVRVTEKVGYCNTSGVMVIPAIYKMSLMFNEGLAPVFNDAGKAGYIDQKNNLVIGYSYDDAYVFVNGLAAVQKNDKWGFIRKDGTVAIDFLYDGVNSFWEGMGAVKTNNKYGYIDQTGKLTIPIQFDGALGFSEGLAAVKQGSLWGYINSAGTMKILPQYKDADDFTNGIAWVIFLDGTFGYIDGNANVIWKESLSLK